MSFDQTDRKLQNLRVAQKTKEEAFEGNPEECISNAYRGEFLPQAQAANRPSLLKGGMVSIPSVSDGPPPSFLTGTPLGTPREETTGFKSSGSKPGVVRPADVRQQGEIATVPLARKGVAQARHSPENLVQKTGPSRETAKPHEGNGNYGSIYHWNNKKVGLSMSKTSIMGLVLGLLFLGVLFFIIGFLAAVATLKSDEKQHSAQSAWQDPNTFSQQDSHGKKSGKWGRIAGAVGANLVGQALHKPLGQIAGAASSAVPQPLKPFARYGIGSTHAAARNAGRQMNPFSPHRMTAPAQQPPIQPPMSQPYMAPPPAQPYYGTPAVPGAYPQAPAPFQGGYAGYAPPLQQQPPPPYYQPQPQMGAPQYPQYPQQMPQQRYYP